MHTNWFIFIEISVEIYKDHKILGCNKCNQRWIPPSSHKNNSFYCLQVIATSSGTLYHCIVLPKSDEADVETSSQVSDASCKFTGFSFTSVSCHCIRRVSAMRTYWRFFRKIAIFSSKLFCLTYFISIEKYPQLTYESNFSPRRLANPGEVSMDSNSLLEIGNLMQS